MARNLFDFGNENVEDIAHNKNAENNLTNDLDNIQNTYEKYKNYSQDELLKVFLKTSKQKIKDGSLSMEGLQQTINSLQPFLNEKQVDFLREIVKKVDE